jgi:hypothetical protein
MTALCFWNRNSLTPMCGVHNAALVKTIVQVDNVAPHLGQISCYICPKSGRVLQELPTQS